MTLVAWHDFDRCSLRLLRPLGAGNRPPMPMAREGFVNPESTIRRRRTVPTTAKVGRNHDGTSRAFTQDAFNSRAVQ